MSVGLYQKRPVEAVQWTGDILATHVKVVGD